MDDAGKAAILSRSSLFGWHTVLATKLYAAPAPSPEMKPELVAGGAPAAPSPKVRPALVSGGSCVVAASSSHLQNAKLHGVDLASVSTVPRGPSSEYHPTIAASLLAPPRGMLTSPSSSRIGASGVCCVGLKPTAESALAYSCGFVTWGICTRRAGKLYKARSRRRRR